MRATRDMSHRRISFDREWFIRERWQRVAVRHSSARPAQDNFYQIVKECRPLSILRFKTPFPFFVDTRARYPCTLTRFPFFG